jgi:hypothetical protein
MTLDGCKRKMRKRILEKESLKKSATFKRRKAFRKCKPTLSKW